MGLMLSTSSFFTGMRLRTCFRGTIVTAMSKTPSICFYNIIKDINCILPSGSIRLEIHELFFTVKICVQNLVTNTFEALQNVLS